jgi:hypothetical protein
MLHFCATTKAKDLFQGYPLCLPSISDRLALLHNKSNKMKQNLFRANAGVANWLAQNA